MRALAYALSQFNDRLGKAVSWLSLAMVLMMFWNVTQRYLFASGQPWEQELVTFMHAALFLLAAGYTLKEDKHVRVDILYARCSPRRKAWLEIFGTLFFLFPVCAALMAFSWDYLRASWEVREASPEYNGMPGIFLLKSCIWVFCISVMMQGFAKLVESAAFLRSGK